MMIRHMQFISFAVFFFLPFVVYFFFIYLLRVPPNLLNFNQTRKKSALDFAKFYWWIGYQLQFLLMFILRFGTNMPARDWKKICMCSHYYVINSLWNPPISLGVLLIWFRLSLKSTEIKTFQKFDFFKSKIWLLFHKFIFSCWWDYRIF